LSYFVLGFITWLTLLEPARNQPTLVDRVDAVYKVVDGQELPVDLFLPNRAEEPTAVVVFIHGGGWFLRGKLDYHDYASVLAINGMAAAAIEWRRVPPNGFHDQVADIKDSIRWLRANAEHFNIDPDRIGIYGSSSGGHLAAMTALTGDGDGFSDDDPEGPSSAVQAAWLHEGLYDLTESVNPIEDLVIQVFVGGVTREEDITVYEDVSPVYRVTSNAPPIMISYGSEDVAVPITQPERLERELLEAGVAAERFVLDGLSHGFIFFRPWTRPIMMEALLEYMRETL
jgi:acetyl esterase/lipase